MPLKISLLIFVMSFSLHGFASVKDLSKKFSLGFAAEDPSFLFRVEPADEDINQKVVYRPNTRSLAGITATAFGLSVAYLTLADPDPSEQAKKGKTSYEDIRLSLFFGRDDQWLISGYYTRYKGFYIENSTDIDPTLTGGDPLLQRGDLEFFNAGASLMYLWDPDDWSAAALFSYSAVQKRSGGSLILRMDTDNSLFSAESAIIPSQVQSSFGEDALITKGRFATLSAMIGYGHTFVYNGFYLGLAGMVGKGLQQREITVSDENFNSTDNINKLNLSIGLGYNDEVFYSGISYRIDELDFKTRSLHVFSNLQALRLSLGFRF